MALVFVAGGLWGLCFGAEPLLVAPWVVLVPLFLIMGCRRPALWGFLHGLGFWLVSIPWIAPTLQTYGGLARPLTLALLVALCSYLAVFHLLFVRLGRGLWCRGGAAALFGLPALWVALEWLRTYLIVAFPWNLAGYAAVDAPGALALSAWIGAYGVSFLVLLVNAGLALAVRGRRWQTGAWVAALACLVLLSAARWSSSAAPSRSASGLVVHVVQPNTVTSPDAVDYRDDYRRLLEISRRACGRRPGLVVWPESAAWPYSYDGSPFLVRDLAGLARAGCPVLLNSPTRDGERYLNSALLVDIDGVSSRYHKRLLVPFGEYVPPVFGWLPFVGKLARNVGDFTAGRDDSPLPIGRQSLGVSICFEVIFPGEVAALARSGATLLATLTNDSWYGDTAAPWQHFRAARFRAAENRRPMIRAAITGVSALIGPRGEVFSRLAVLEEGVLTKELVGRSDRTVYSRAPWLPPLLCSLVAAFAIFRSSGAWRRPSAGKPIP